MDATIPSTMIGVCISDVYRLKKLITSLKPNKPRKAAKNTVEYVSILLCDWKFMARKPPVINAVTPITIQMIQEISHPV